MVNGRTFILERLITKFDNREKLVYCLLHINQVNHEGAEKAAEIQEKLKANSVRYTPGHYAPSYYSHRHIPAEPTAKFYLFDDLPAEEQKEWKDIEDLESELRKIDGVREVFICPQSQIHELAARYIISDFILDKIPEDAVPLKDFNMILAFLGGAYQVGHVRPIGNAE